MEHDLWSVLTLLDETIRLHEQDMKPGIYHYLLDMIHRAKDANAGKDGHWSSPNGCHKDCPACKEI